MKAEQRIAELRAAIRRADHLYYNVGRAELTDAEYDRLFQELRKFEAAHPELVTPDSPTQRVGAPLPKGSSFPTAAHLAPMGSIESLTTADEVREFTARARRALALPDGAQLEWICEPKLDGVSANLLFEHGRLVRGLSRGDGETGEDITRNLRTVRNLPLHFLGDGPFPPRIEIRGEVIMSRKEFARLQATEETTAEGTFRNARNTAAGTLKLLDPRIVQQRQLDFLAYGTGYMEGLDCPTHVALRKHLRAWGFQVVDPHAVVHDADGIAAFRDRLEARRDALSYEMDGVVAKVDRLDLQQQLGRTARTPRWALAYKFEPRVAVTEVLGIGAQVGRTGTVTPVAHLAPVELAGVTVRNATLHNWGLLAERDVREGDTVEIQRAGDVIPEVVRVLLERRPRSSRPAQPPSKCPGCDGPVEAEGKFLYCVNLDCPDQLRGRILHLASRRALDIEGLGPKQVEQLQAAGLLRRVEDVFALPHHRARVQELERWGEKSTANLVAEIERARTPTLARFLCGIGIRHVGEQTAKDLAAHFGSLDRLQAATAEELTEVDGVGEEVAASVLHFFASPHNRRTLAALAAAGVEVQRQVGKERGPLAGRVFVFTGGLSSMSRDAARERAERLGAKTAASVSKKVTDVVAGSEAGSKLDKARELGLRILTEDEFVQLVGNP